ncbi:MAG TPA: fatty acid--CoA ligase [Acidimicrobiales bacterium]|jgi:long-chain acyl-CoA synthetase|nr:fatty acid--CoA ligase [Acidimicrobiales bacterium]
MSITNIAGIVRTHAASSPDGAALLYEGTTITWRDLDERSSRVANGLAAEGVAEQGRIARIDKNGPDYFELLMGAGKINAVLVDVNWRLAPPEMAQIVNDAQATVLFVGSEFVPQLEKFQADLQTVKTIVVIGGGSATLPSYDDWLGSQSAEDPGVEPAPDDVCLQLYTSGTTGLPKGVMLTNRNLFSFIEEVPRAWGFDQTKTSIVVMPLFHIAGSGWGLVGMATGARTVLLREVDPVKILAAVEQERVTHAIFVPAVLQFLLITPTLATTDVSSLELIAYGASPISEAVLRASIDAFKCKFVQVYGLTETTGAAVQLDAEDHDPDNRPELLRSCGKPYPWIEVKVVDPDGNEVAEGEVGELWMRGVQIMKGYWNKPDETARAITDDGWFKTGDAGYWRDGYLYLHDRVKDMIVSGGENVYPAEIENVLMAHPAVADVGVIGVPHDKWGETVKAMVVKADGADPTSEELIAYCRERLAGFKCPTSIDFIDALPRNPSGKILKRELREPFWAGRERRIN